MANDKFSKILLLIKEVFALIADLIPVVDVALDAIASARQLIADFKEKQVDDNKEQSQP